MGTRITALVVCAGLSIGSAAFAEPPKIRWQHSASSDTPEGLVFSDYLNYFSEELRVSRQEAVHFLMFTLELPDNAEGQSSAEIAVGILQQASADIASETLASDIAAYCPGGTEVRTNDQIFQVMDQQDEAYVRIADSNYLKTLAQLDSVMAGKLRAKVAKHKKAYSVAALDHKDAWEAADLNPDMRSVVTNMCSELLASRQGQQ